ncbi:UNVERIFIED_ORG: ppGpp synthetase/RelA/SpoT-type nucleotidyltransferase [Pseudomonas fluorescens]
MKRKAAHGTALEKKTTDSSSVRTDDMWTKNPAIIKKFLDAKPQFEQLCNEVEYILKKKVSAAQIETSFLGSRAKTLNSFLEKLNRKSYTAPFDQLDDLAGVRVVCLYSSDISNIIDIIRNEFEIVQEIDKREELETNKFGYIGNHFIIRLGTNYSGARYDDLRTLRCEIQVRTVVQDAWSIIQHHMVYKKESQVPSNLIRKLNGLAGLFETVDDQFEFIRMQRDIYLDSIRESKNAPSDFLENEINYDSLVEFMQWRYDETFDEADREMVSIILDVFKEIKISTLKDIENLLVKNEKFIDLSTKAYLDILQEEDPENGHLIWEPIKVPVAISANPEWRSKLPWGRSWRNAFIQADKNL